MQFHEGTRGDTVISLPMRTLFTLARDRVAYATGESVDPDAVAQQFCVEVEKAAGIFPNTSKLETIEQPEQPAEPVVNTRPLDVTADEVAILYMLVAGMMKSYIGRLAALPIHMSLMDMGKAREIEKHMNAIDPLGQKLVAIATAFEDGGKLDG